MYILLLQIIFFFLHWWMYMYVSHSFDKKNQSPSRGAILTIV
jgi:hypothetical protein